jgi:hypothetical protein
MNDFLVLIITKDLFAFLNIQDYFEEEDSVTFIDTMNNVLGEATSLNAIAADLVVFMDTWTSGKLYERISKKVGSSYVECSDTEKAKEIISEKFLEWSEKHGTESEEGC